MSARVNDAANRSQAIVNSHARPRCFAGTLPERNVGRKRLKDELSGARERRRRDFGKSKRRQQPLLAQVLARTYDGNLLDRSPVFAGSGSIHCRSAGVASGRPRCGRVRRPAANRRRHLSLIGSVRHPRRETGFPCSAHRNKLYPAVQKLLQRMGAVPKPCRVDEGERLRRVFRFYLQVLGLD